MTSEMTLISVNSVCLVQPGFHPDGSVLSKWRPADARVYPVSAGLIGCPLRVECFGACLRIGSLPSREIPLALPSGFITPSDLPAVALQVLSSRIEPGLTSAVLLARLIIRSRMALVPPVVDAHAASCC